MCVAHTHTLTHWSMAKPLVTSLLEKTESFSTLTPTRSHQLQRELHFSILIIIFRNSPHGTHSSCKSVLGREYMCMAWHLWNLRLVFSVWMWSHLKILQVFPKNDVLCGVEFLILPEVVKFKSVHVFCALPLGVHLWFPTPSTVGGGHYNPQMSFWISFWSLFCFYITHYLLFNIIWLFTHLYLST